MKARPVGNDRSCLALDRLADKVGPGSLAEFAARRRHNFRTIFHFDVTLAHRLMREAIYPHSAADAEQYTRKPQTVRLHHELTRLEREDYAFYLGRIMR